MSSELLKDQGVTRTAALEAENAWLRDTLNGLRLRQRKMVHEECGRALEQLASGITHEFNNSLSPVTGYVELLLHKPALLADEATATKYLRSVLTAAQEVTKVVQSLHGFYRQRPDAAGMGPIEVSQLVTQAVESTRLLWGDRTKALDDRVVVETDLEVAQVFGDRNALHEVLRNLILNAVDAMPDGGRILISTAQRDGDVVLTVTDNGFGMSEQVVKHCFDPFFSTKGERGTGLGLANALRQVERHLGAMGVTSAPGQGTTFQVWLPARSAQVEALLGDEERESA